MLMFRIIQFDFIFIKYIVYSNNFCKTMAELNAIAIPRDENESYSKSAKTKNTREYIIRPYA